MIIDKRKMPILEKRSKTCRRIGLKTVRMLAREDRFVISAKIMEESGRKGFAARFAKAAIDEMPEGDHRRFEMARYFGLEEEMERAAPAMVLKFLMKMGGPDIEAAKDVIRNSGLSREKVNETVRGALTRLLGERRLWDCKKDTFKVSLDVALAFGLDSDGMVEAGGKARAIQQERGDFRSAALLAMKFGTMEQVKKDLKQFLLATKPVQCLPFRETKIFFSDLFRRDVEEAKKMGLSHEDEMDVVQTLVDSCIRSREFRPLAQIAEEYGLEKEKRLAVEGLCGPWLEIGEFRHAKGIADATIFEEVFPPERLLEFFRDCMLNIITMGKKDRKIRAMNSLLREAVEIGVGSEKELARKAFLFLKEHGHFIETFARIAGLDDELYESRKRSVFDALKSNNPIRRIRADGDIWDKRFERDKEVQKAAQEAIMQNMKQGEYSRAAEIAFAFQMDGLAEGIEKACKELGILLRYEKHRLQAEVFYSM